MNALRSNPETDLVRQSRNQRLEKIRNYRKMRELCAGSQIEGHGHYTKQGVGDIPGKLSLDMESSAIVE